MSRDELAPRSLPPVDAVTLARAEVAVARDELLARLHAAQGALHRATDLREVARRHPVMAAIGVVALGLLALRLLSRR